MNACRLALHSRDKKQAGRGGACDAAAHPHPAACLLPAGDSAAPRVPRGGAAAFPDTHALSYRDEEIVLMRRRGLADFEIARELGHFVHVVIAALARAETLGIPTTPIAATASGRTRRTS